MPTRCTPGVRGTCAMYIAPNLPAPITPMRRGFSLLSRSFAYKFISGGLEGGLQLVGGRAVLPGKRDIVVPEQAVVGQRPDRREVAVRDVTRAPEAPDVVRYRAEREIHAHAVPGREVRRRSVHQAAVEQDHRPGRSLRRDDAAAIDQLVDGLVVDHPERIAGGRGVVGRVEHAE